MRLCRIFLQACRRGGRPWALCRQVKHRSAAPRRAKARGLSRRVLAPHVIAPRVPVRTVVAHQVMGLKIVGWLMLLGVLPWAVHADSDGAEQNLEQLRLSVGEFLQEHYTDPGVAKIEVKVGRLDSRLRLKHCEQPLEMTLNDPELAGGNLTIHTRCLGPTPWALYVPAQISVFRPVAVAARALNRGDRISGQDVVLELKDTGLLRQGFVASSDSVVNKELRRALREGEPFRQSVLVEPLAVERGDQVRLQAQTGPITVNTKGTALSSGRVGEQINVRNDGSERVVRGKIVSPGTVEVVL